MPEDVSEVRIEGGRKPKASLAKEYRELIDQNLPEQRYQDFFEENTWLLPREFILNHGINFDLVLRKLKMSADYTCDFFYLSKSSCEWNCVLIELEKPYSKYFKDGSDDFHDDFLAGIKQIKRWRAWFEEPGNHAHFVDTILQSVRLPANMARNPCVIKYVLVTGRNTEFSDSPRRRNLIRMEENEHFSVLSYDSLVNSLHSRGELYVGIRHNEYIEIKSTNFISETMFVYIPPEQLRIKESLRDDILRNKEKWRFISGSWEPEATQRKKLDDVLPKIRVI